jgi:uncharacterized protein YdhG (YjbR/CyaY superfamily)
MQSKRTAPKDIDDYIAGFPPEVQERLQKVRATIKKAAPDGEETISYQIPTFKLHGYYLIYFAGFEKHISVYPVPRGAPEFQEDLAAYKGGKGTMQIPHGQPIPFDLITRIVNYRAEENKARAAAKKKKK